jgi:hypothetical protein
VAGVGQGRDGGEPARSRPETFEASAADSVEVGTRDQAVRIRSTSWRTRALASALSIPDMRSASYWVSTWRTEAATASRTARASSTRPAALLATRPLPLRVEWAAITTARPAGHPGKCSMTAAANIALEFGVPLPSSFLRSPAAPRPCFLVSEAFGFRLLQGRLLHEQSLTFVAPPGSAESDHHGRKLAGPLCPSRQSCVPAREEDQVVEVGTGQAQRPGSLQPHEVTGSRAFNAGPVVEGVDHHQIRHSGLTRLGSASLFVPSGL